MRRAKGHSEVAINLNPYQGLKHHTRLLHALGEGCNQPKSLSGIETQLEGAYNATYNVAINLNPYQGLKPAVMRSTNNPTSVSCNQPKSLSGIETELCRHLCMKA